ncbi:carnitine acetyl transferase [Dichomitus squalens]|uniref:Carnitine acetyl transferase n=1 Tax=Dichomitus squalens TaxID=114155 RepID=A0A4Q9PTB6_9APHY|nr:carnitine acetyl transferase [Dichomitus squalens]TBU57722.1 carnitine acetyl transferase [Dichomitus squalens]
MSTTPFSTTRPANWKALAPPPLPGPTFAAQANLPRLPVPALSETLTKLKETLKPIAWSEQEYADAVKAVDEFGSSPYARELQDRLQKRSQEPGRVHWLEEWWDDLAYMGYRDSVVVNVSYYYGFKEHPSSLPQTPVHRAASLVRAVMAFREQFKLGQIPPEATKEGPICMDTWRWMFDCCRIPGAGLDWAVSHAKEGDNGRSGHVVVLHRGRVWKLEPWQDGKLLSLDELQGQIQHIYDNTNKEYPGVGVLTASNRDVWAKDFQTLAADPQNAHILTEIHSSAFVLSLDTESASSFVEHSRLLWHGAVVPPPQPGIPHAQPQLGLRNRWMDKPLQFVVLADGKAGLVGEHSVMDGTPTATMCDRVLDLIAAPDFATTANSSEQSTLRAKQLPEPLDWNVSPEIQKAIDSATEAAVALISSQTLQVVRTPYGKAAVKAFGVSPDGWTQLIIQLAYARLLKAKGWKRNGGTYEAASVRKFLKGRTEAIRVVSEQSDRWVASMDDPAADARRRVQLFAEAIKTHGTYARAAGNAHGVDRHLLGLKLLVREGEQVPEVFSNPVVKRSSYWVLSTSAINAKNFGPYGWGEVVPDGFGVAYTTGFDDFLQFTVTSRTEMPNDEFCEELQRAARDIYDLFASQSATQKAKL